MSSEPVIRAFLQAVERRDLDAVGRCFSPGARYANVPNPPVEGPAGVRALFAPILGRAQRVRWDVVTAAYLHDRAHLERVDRFWIDGAEYAIECHGVFQVDPGAGLITEVRDYVDLATWRRRLEPAGI